MKKHLSKDKFIHYIAGYAEESAAFDKLYDLTHFDDYENPLCYSSTHFLELLSEAFADTDEQTIIISDILSWWVYETAFGRGGSGYVEPIIYDETCKKELIKLDTVDKLYDYLISLED